MSPFRKDQRTPEPRKPPTPAPKLAPELMAELAAQPEPPPVVGTPVTVVPPLPVPTVQLPTEPPMRPPEPVKATKPLGEDWAPEFELAELRKRIAADEARIWQLEHPIIEFPKMVKGRTFASRAEQDAAGPDFADA